MILEWFKKIAKSNFYKFILLCSITTHPLLLSLLIDNIPICYIISIVFTIGFILIHQNITAVRKQLDEEDNGVLRCPKCNNDKWINGSGGGSFGNIECDKCGTKYNDMGPFGLQEIK